MKQITCPHCGDTYPDFDVAHVCSKGPYAPKLKTKMNERIETLAKAAGYDMINKAAMRSLGFDVEKFAELIVKECCQKLENDGMVEVAMEMKEHFGVEE